MLVGAYVGNYGNNYVYEWEKYIIFLFSSDFLQANNGIVWGGHILKIIKMPSSGVLFF